MNFLLKYQNLQLWCPTEVDKDGVFQGDPNQGVDPWGICGPDCPTHEETLTWTTDETFKMTLQYDNTLLKEGIELYGILLAGISICGLMIILVPATGKRQYIIFTINKINIYINSSHDEF